MKNNHHNPFSSEAFAMYKENILDHYRHPRHFGLVSYSKHRGSAANPLCGDEGEISLAFGEDGRVSQTGFQGKGCAISQASLSMLTEVALGKTKEGLQALEEKDIFSMLGIPITYTRTQCALLSLRALKQALKE